MLWVWCRKRERGLHESRQHHSVSGTYSTIQGHHAKIAKHDTKPNNKTHLYTENSFWFSICFFFWPSASVSRTERWPAKQQTSLPKSILFLIKIQYMNSVYEFKLFLLFSCSNYNCFYLCRFSQMVNEIELVVMEREKSRKIQKAIEKRQRKRAKAQQNCTFRLIWFN